MEQPTPTRSRRESLEDALKSLEDDGSLSTLARDHPMKSKPPLIQRVTQLLRDKEGSLEPFFKPMYIAFGPLHLDDSPHSTLQRGEENKLQMAAKFIKDSGKEKEVFYEKVKAEIDVLKSCYDCKQVEKWEEDDLAWMFVVDGCALLLFIYHDVNDSLEPLKVKDDVLEYVKMDLFLLENQLPYQLLQILMDSCDGFPLCATELNKSITTFINKNVISPVEQEQQNHRVKNSDQQQTAATTIGTQREPAHLLERLWRRMTESKKHKESDGTSCGDKCIYLKGNREPSGRTRHYKYTFRNVKELKEKGILLKVSMTSNISDISFEKRFGILATLRLPPITVDKFTERKLMNLIAYEMCPDFDNEFQISSYVSLLATLIDQAEDVKELRAAGVLHNGLGSDKAVALLLNGISKYLVPNHNLHSNLKECIQAHCNTALTRNIAQFYYNYFRSPWSFWALLGALLGLALTAVQTYEDIKQSPSPVGSFPSHV